MTAIASIVWPSWQKPQRLFAAVLLSSIAAIGIGSTSASGEEICVRDGGSNEAGEECPVPIRLRPTFSEEGERGFQVRSLADSFLGEALNGVADPLGRSSVGGDSFGLDATVSQLEAGDRGFSFDTRFDPTNVIIPLDAVPDK